MLALVTGRSHRQDRAMPCVRFAPCGDRRPDEGERRRLGYPPRQNQTRPRVPVEPARYFRGARSEEHTSELQSLMRISYAVFCLKKKNTTTENAHDIILHIYQMSI